MARTQCRRPRAWLQVRVRLRYRRATKSDKAAMRHSSPGQHDGPQDQRTSRRWVSRRPRRTLRTMLTSGGCDANVDSTCLSGKVGRRAGRSSARPSLPDQPTRQPSAQPWSQRESSVPSSAEGARKVNRFPRRAHGSPRQSDRHTACTPRSSPHPRPAASKSGPALQFVSLSPIQAGATTPPMRHQQDNRPPR